MGTFTRGGKEYQKPAVPFVYNGKPGLAKAWERGWSRGIWEDAPCPPNRYKTASMQRAFAVGHSVARQTRREAGEQVE